MPKRSRRGKAAARNALEISFNKPKVPKSAPLTYTPGVVQPNRICHVGIVQSSISTRAGRPLLSLPAPITLPLTELHFSHSPIFFKHATRHGILSLRRCYRLDARRRCRDVCHRVRTERILTSYLLHPLRRPKRRARDARQPRGLYCEYFIIASFHAKLGGHDWLISC